MLSPKKRLVVIGGGAAGFFCAVTAARFNPSLDIIILEKTNKVLSKVKISGGGRCNVTHACFEIEKMILHYPRGMHFVKKAFHQFFTTDTIQWFEERGVELKKEADGRMFPASNSSQTIIDCLMREINKYNINIKYHAEVKAINIADGSFQLIVGDDKEMTADFICIACGGYPKTSMFNWIQQLGHTIAEPVPSLFTFNIPNNDITKLMGISVEQATIKIAGSKLEETGPLLITHWGLSGPAILRLSAWGARELAQRQYTFTIRVNWLPAMNEQTLRDKMQQLRINLASQKIYHKNLFGLPQRLWEYLLQQSNIQETMRWADVPAVMMNLFIKHLCSMELDVKGKTTFKEEFVTAGGVQLNEADANTMMSKRVPHLFFAGEILDVDGITGGFNFQHAWTSGFIAGKTIAGKLGDGS